MTFNTRQGYLYLLFELDNGHGSFETLFFNKTFIAYVCLEIYFKKFVDKDNIDADNKSRQLRRYHNVVLKQTSISK